MGNRTVRFEDLPTAGHSFSVQVLFGRRGGVFSFYLRGLFCTCLKMSCVILPSLIAEGGWIKTQPKYSPLELFEVDEPHHGQTVLTDTGRTLLALPLQSEVLPQKLGNSPEGIP